MHSCQGCTTARQCSHSDREGEANLEQDLLFQTAAKILHHPDFNPDVPDEFPVQLFHWSTADSGTSVKKRHHSGSCVRGCKALGTVPILSGKSGSVPRISGESGSVPRISGESGSVPRVFQSKKTQCYLVQFPDGQEFQGRMRILSCLPVS